MFATKLTIASIVQFKLNYRAGPYVESAHQSNHFHYFFAGNDAATTRNADLAFCQQSEFVDCV